MYTLVDTSFHLFIRTLCRHSQSLLRASAFLTVYMYIFLSRLEKFRWKMQSNVALMDGSKPFHTLNQVKLHLKLVGCSPIESNRFYRFFCIPIYIAVIFIILISYSLSSLSFLFFNVKTFIDFTESAFWASRSVLSLAVYTTFVWHRKDLTKILDNLNEIIYER